MDINFLYIFLSALIPLLVGFVWYNPKVFGNAWMKASGLTEESMQGANMALIFGLSFVFAILIAFLLSQMVIHQGAILSVLFGEPGFMEEGSEVTAYYNDFIAKYGENHRNFGHGAFHGVFVGLLFVTPIIATVSLFERKGFKYIAINGGYWIVSLALMGGVLCAFA